MPQVLKDEVEQRIREAALEVFAGAGFAGASMAQIARTAGISAGNIYRYFPGKKALFAGVLPRSLADCFMELLRRRVEAARAESDLAAVAPESPYALAARATVDFALEHRREAIILIARGAKTPYAAFGDQVVDLLVAEALRYAAGVTPDEVLRFDLVEMYRSYVQAWARILERFEVEDDARQALAVYERYHLAGLRALFA